MKVYTESLTEEWMGGVAISLYSNELTSARLGRSCEEGRVECKELSHGRKPLFMLAASTDRIDARLLLWNPARDHSMLPLIGPCWSSPLNLAPQTHAPGSPGHFLSSSLFRRAWDRDDTCPTPGSTNPDA